MRALRSGPTNAKRIARSTDVGLGSMEQWRAGGKDPSRGGRSLEPDLAVIMLAGGDSNRTQHFCRELCGAPKPRHLCNIIGNRSMLEHALARASLLTHGPSIWLVASAPHHLETRRQCGPYHPTELVEPTSRGTAPATLLGLSHVLGERRKSVVAVMPSDQFVREDVVFMDHVREAVRLARVHPELCIVLGVEPDSAETEYSWICLDRESSNAGVRQVHAFFRRPSVGVARLLLREQTCLWSTQVLVARPETLWKMLGEHLPDLVARFESARARGTLRDPARLAEFYASLPEVSLAIRVLERNPARLRALAVPDVLWCDWGSVPRIRETLVRLGRLEELNERLLENGLAPAGALG